MLKSMRALAGVALVAACLVPAHASSPFSALKELLQTETAFHSRTCGLVLLSNGRAQVRAMKESSSPAYDQPMAQLTKAFLLLRDGRAVTGGRQGPRDFFQEKLSTGKTGKLHYQALPEAVSHCQRWFDTRRGQADFDMSEEAQWESGSQAKMTLEAE